MIHRVFLSKFFLSWVCLLLCFIKPMLPNLGIVMVLGLANTQFMVSPKNKCGTRLECFLSRITSAKYHVNFQKLRFQCKLLRGIHQRLSVCTSTVHVFKRKKRQVHTVVYSTRQTRSMVGRGAAP